VPIEPAEILKNERERKAAEAKQSETEAEKKLFLAVEAVPASLYVSEPNKLNKSPTTAAVDMNKSLQVIGNINGSRDMHKRSNNSIRNMNLSQNMLAQCRSLQHIPTGSENTSQTDENSNQPPKGLVEKLKKIIDLSIFFDFIFVFFGISNFFTSLGFNAPFIFITDQATSVSIPADHAAWLLSTIGISNTVGRVILGLLADLKCMNRLYLYGTVLTVCGLATCIEPFFTSFTGLFIYSVVFGFTSGKCKNLSFEL